VRLGVLRGSRVDGVSLRAIDSTNFVRRYDDIDLQHAIAQEHWYVCGYKVNMKHPITEETHHLFHDADPSTPMFRVVVKANLSMPMADNLVASIAKSFAFLDAHGAGFNSHPHHVHQPHHKAC